MNFTIETGDLTRIRDTFATFSDRRFSAGLATALTRTAQAVQKAEVAEMRDVFDRPTPYTLNSIFVKPAIAANLEAQAGIKDDYGGSRSALAWLRWHITGGQRTPKAFEKLLMRAGAMHTEQRVVPGKFARLDAFGNISRGQIVQILSQLRIDTTAGSTRSLPRVLKGDNKATARAKANTIRRSYGRAGGRYVAFPNGRGRLKPGVYLNEGHNFGAKVGYGNSSRMRPVLVYVSKAEYEAGNFDFDYVGRRVVERELPLQVNRALQEHLQRLALKQTGSPAA
jgi:hypothetical protein